jgi:uncharacterized membrane protein
MFFLSVQKHDKITKKYIKIISTIGIVLCLIGLVDSIYLTMAHYSNKVTLACPTKGIINCEKVTSSQYSEIHGIPVPIFGLLFFICMIILQLPYAWRLQEKIVRWGRLAFSIVGLISVFWFVYVEFQILNAICLYCTLVHALTFGLFVLTLFGTSLIVPKKNTISEE